MSLKFAVGDLTIHRIIEQETTFLPALVLCFQSYVVKTPAPHHPHR